MLSANVSRNAIAFPSPVYLNFDRRNVRDVKILDCGQTAQISNLMTQIMLSENLYSILGSPH